MRRLLAGFAGLLVLAPGASAAVFESFSAGIAAGADPQEITMTSDAVWFTEPGTVSIGKRTYQGVVTEHVVSLNATAAPFGITVGGDGNLWFTQPALNKVGVMSPATGALVTSYTVSAGPRFIARHGDGNVWFTLQGANKIGRLTQDGVLTEFVVPTAASGLNGITQGSDGNMWFVESTANKIGRITPAGAVTEFATPAGIVSPYQIITSNTDGHLYFTDQSSAHYGRMTTAGVGTTFNAVSGTTSGIATGSDASHVFMTQPSNHRLSRAFTSSQALVQYSMSPLVNPTPTGIVNGFDGNLYATDPAADAIIRIKPDYPTEPVTGPASELTGTTARLTGTVNPKNSVADFRFAYGTSPALGSLSGFGTQIPAGDVPVPVSLVLPGLSPGTKYYFALRSQSFTWSAASVGDILEFTTPTVPSVTAEIATDVTPHSAKLRGTVGTGGAATTYHFDYGTTPEYGQSTPEQSAGSSGEVAAEATLTDLPAWSEFHWRLVATNVVGTSSAFPAPGRTYPDLAAGTPGTLTATFPVDFGGTMPERFYRATLDAQGRTLAIGLTRSGATFDMAVARLLPDGSLDPSFDGDGRMSYDFDTTHEHAIGVAAVGDKIYVAGSDGLGGQLVRLDSGGALDTTFGGAGKLRPPHNIADFGMQGGKVVVAGWNTVNTVMAVEVSRLLDDGTPDPAFGLGGTRRVVVPGVSFSKADALAFDSLGRIVVGAQTSQHPAVIRLTPDGAFDETFDGDGIRVLDLAGYGPSTVEVLPGDDLLLVANSSISGPSPKLLRITSAGAIDGTFGDAGIRTLDIPSASRAVVTDAERDPAGRWLLSGLVQLNGVDSGLLARLTPAGDLDPAFGVAGLNVLPQTVSISAFLPVTPVARRTTVPLRVRAVGGLVGEGEPAAVFDVDAGSLEVPDPPPVQTPVPPVPPVTAPPAVPTVPTVTPPQRDTTKPTARLTVRGKVRRGRKVTLVVTATDASGIRSVTIKAGRARARAVRRLKLRLPRRRGSVKVVVRVTDRAGNVSLLRRTLRVR